MVPVYSFSQLSACIEMQVLSRSCAGAFLIRAVECSEIMFFLLIYLHCWYALKTSEAQVVT